MADTNATKSKIVKALRELLESKPFESVTVSDIIVRSGISRKTFYYHFNDKYALVNWMFYQKCLVIKNEVLDENPWDYIRSVAELLEEERPVFANLLQNMGQNSFGQYFSDLFYELYQNSLSGGFRSALENEESVDIALTALVEITRMSFVLWLSRPEGQSADELVAELRKMAEAFGAMTCYGRCTRSGEQPCDISKALLGDKWSPVPTRENIQSVPPEREGHVRTRIRTDSGGYRRAR